MPVIDMLAVEITKQCIETVSEQIINRLMDIIGFGGLFINNDNLFIKSDDLRSSNFDGADHNKRPQSNRCDVTIMPGYNPLETPFDFISGRTLDSHLQAKRWTFGEIPLFNDARSDVKLYEVTLPSTVELQFEVRLKSIELSDAFNMALFSKSLSGGSVYDYNDIQFSYGLPDKLIVLLYKIYKMQTDLHPTVTFQEYLTYYSNNAIIPLVNRNRLDGDRELIMQRNNARVLGKLNYDGDKHETEDFNKVSNRYVIDFTYVFQFAKPSLLRLAYPIMIYNKQIDGQFIGKPRNMSYGEGPQHFADYATNNYFLTNNEAQIDLDRSYPHVQYPFYDDWVRSPAMYCDIITRYQTLFTGLLHIVVDPADGSLSLAVDIKNEIFPMIRADIAAEFEKVVKEFNLDPTLFRTFNDIFRRLGIFDIAVFSNDAMVPFEKLSLNSDLVLTVAGPLNISRIYRVVISQIRDITILNKEYVYYMLDNPTYYADFLALHMGHLIQCNYVKVIKQNPFTNTPDVNIQHRDIQTEPWQQYPNRALTINNYVVEVCRAR